MKIFGNRLLPILMTVILIITYIVSNETFIKCGWQIGCVGLNPLNISEVTVKQENNLNETPKYLATRSDDFKDKKNRVKVYEEAVDKTNAELAEILKAQNFAQANANTAEANLKPLKERKDALDAVLKNQNADLTRLKNDSNTAGEQVLEIRKQVAERYSKRVLFMFLTAAFMLLSLAAVIISITVIRESVGSLDDENRRLHGYPVFRYWQLFAAVCALTFGAVIYNFFEKQSLALVIPLYDQSIWKNGDISRHLIHFINCVGFTATIWLVFAANAVLIAVKSKKNFIEARAEALNRQKGSLNEELAAEPDAAKQAALSERIVAKETSLAALAAGTTSRFASRKRNITIILYVGGLMLFVGMLRMKMLFDWHLIFVSTDINNSFYVLLKNFFDSMLTVQAGFYSILLTVIYLPVVYAIPSVETEDAASESNLLEKLGLPFSNEFLLKAFAVFLPTLASPVTDFFTYFLGGKG